MRDDPGRELNTTEQLFISEAEAGSFAYGYEDDGQPWAMGAWCTGNLFSMEVIEDQRDDCAVYWIRYPEDEL